MSQTFVVPCSCGASIPVQISQAGATVHCSCGKTVDVPKLRELRKLEPVVEPDTKKRSSWSQLQGSLFVGGMLAIMIASGSACYVWSFRQNFDTRKPDLSNVQFQYDISDIPLTRSWELWKEYGTRKIDERPTPYHVLAREKVNALNRWLTFFGALGGAGAISLIAAFFVRSG